VRDTELRTAFKKCVTSNKGKVSATDLVVLSDRTPQECKNFLERLSSELNAEVLVLNNGSMVYRFDYQNNSLESDPIWS